jgi:hypothetical protein
MAEILPLPYAVLKSKTNLYPLLSSVIPYSNKLPEPLLKSFVVFTA